MPFHGLEKWFRPGKSESYEEIRREHFPELEEEELEEETTTDTDHFDEAITLGNGKEKPSKKSKGGGFFGNGWSDL
jgi:hypothetical protein